MCWFWDLGDLRCCWARADAVPNLCYTSDCDGADRWLQLRISSFSICFVSPICRIMQCSIRLGLVLVSTARIHFSHLYLSDQLNTNSILADNCNRALQGNVTMHETQPGGQHWNQCKWRHLMIKFWTNASCPTWWPNFQLVAKFAISASSSACLQMAGGAIWLLNMQLIQVAPSGGQICD